MKIGFVLDDTIDSSDGVQQYVLTLGSWLISIGHEVHYLVGQSERKDVDNIHSLAKNVKVKFNKNRMTIPFRAKTSQIINILEEEKFDVLHIQMPYSPQLGAKIIKIAPKTTAIVGTFHILPYGKIEKAGTYLLAKLVKSSFSRIDTVISVSKPAAVFAKQAYDCESVVIPNVVKLPNGTKKQKRNKSKLHIVFVGRLVKRKGVLELLHALSLVDDDLDFMVTVVGSGPLKDDVLRLVRNYGLENRVRLTGFVAEEEKFRILSDADIAVFPSLGGESFGIVLIEAMAAGAEAVIGGNNQGYQAVLEDTQTLFNPCDKVSFSKILSSLLRNSNTRKNIHEKQKLIVKKYDVSSVGPEVLKVYEQAIAKHKPNKDNDNNEMGN